MSQRLRTEEAARFTGVPTRTLERWRYEGVGPPFLKLNALVRYDTRALERWMQARAQTTTGDSASAAD